MCEACGREAVPTYAAAARWMAGLATFCARCVQEFEQGRDYERRVFDMQYEWSSIRGKRPSEFDRQGDDLMASRQRRDFPNETRAMILAHRGRRISEEVKHVRYDQRRARGKA